MIASLSRTDVAQNVEENCPKKTAIDRYRDRGQCRTVRYSANWCRPSMDWKHSWNNNVLFWLASTSGPMWHFTMCFIERVIELFVTAQSSAQSGEDASRVGRDRSSCGGRGVGRRAGLEERSVSDRSTPGGRRWSAGHCRAARFIRSVAESPRAASRGHGGSPGMPARPRRVSLRNRRRFATADHRSTADRTRPQSYPAFIQLRR